MTIRKYRTEYALNIYGHRNLITQPGEFERLLESNGFDEFKDSPLHLYMICRRPRITYDPSAFVATQESIAGAFRVQVGENHEKCKFSLENPYQNSSPSVECPYPHAFATFRWESLANRGMSIHVTRLALAFQEMSEHLTLEVLYIGQSYGKGGSRSAADRLRNHETLQKIYGQSDSLHPDKEIWLLLWNLKSQWIATIDGRPQQLLASESENENHSNTFLRQTITDELEINLAEAALIRYFQPEFNAKFKETFPSRGHEAYSECYDWEINMVVVEVDTEDLGVMLRSTKVAPSSHHTARFAFHSEEERKAMFDFN